MRTIIKIEDVERRERFNTDGRLDKVYFRTHAILDDGSEVIGYGKDFDLGDLVESFWDEKHQVHKMQKRKD